MSSEPSNDRNQQFKSMLLALSNQLRERDLKQMGYLTSTEANEALQLLKVLRNKGVFSPVKCHPLEDLLKEIERHDLADYVKKYLDTYPDQRHHGASFPEKGSIRRLVKKRSSTDPLDMSQSTLSLTLTESTDVQHEQMGGLENGPVLPTCLPNKGKNAVSLESFSQAFSSPETSPSITSGRYRHHSHTLTGSGSMRSTSQTSQEPYSSSSNISQVSSSSSLAQRSIHEEVTDKAAYIIVSRMEQGSEMHREASISQLSMSSSDSRRYYKHSRSCHGPHTGDPDASMPNKKQLSRSLCLPNASNGRILDDLTAHAQSTASAMTTIQSPTITEIWSDPEHAEEERGQVDSNTEHGQKRAEHVPTATSPHSNGELIPNEPEVSGASYDDTTLRSKEKKRNIRDREYSLTPKASLDLEQPPTESRNFDVTLRECQPSSLLGKEDCDHPAATPSPPRAAKPSAKEKIWRNKFPFHRKSKLKQTTRNSLTWRVAREDLNKTICRHNEKYFITHSHKIELDAYLGRRNPKLSFQLYPYGESEDFGKALTLLVRITTSEKCPPLPPLSKVKVSVVVKDDGSDKATEGCEMNRCSVEESLDMGYFRIHGILSHTRVIKSRSKHIYLDIVATCSGIEAEGIQSRSKSFT